MSLILTIPKEYGYVLGAATLSAIISIWHSVNTAKYRRAAKIPLPNAYVTHAEAQESKDKYLFNCAQRAHANFMEHQPQMLVGLLAGGLRYPVVSACMGVAWCAGRVGYTIGYCRRDKENGNGRSTWTMPSTLMEFALIVMGGMTGYQMLMD